MSGYFRIILAGGDGTRLSSLTRQLAGDGRPKQFCRLVGTTRCWSKRVVERGC